LSRGISISVKMSWHQNFFFCRRTHFVAKACLIFSLILTSFFTKAQCVVINEILVNASGGYDGGNQITGNTAEWIEFYNTCNSSVDIGCYVFSDGDFTVRIPSGTIIPAYGYFVVGSYNSDPTVDLDWSTCACTTGGDQVGTLTNPNEQLILKDAAGVLVDAIYWGTGQFPVNINAPAMSGCSAVSFNYNNANASFEQLPPQNNDGCGMERACDGSTTWLEICGNQATPGASNSGEQVLVTFAASGMELCIGDCINFTYTGSGTPTQFEWTFEGASTATGNVSSPQNICYPNAGTFAVELTITNSCGTFDAIIEDYIQVNVGGAITISANGPTTFCEGGSVTLQTTSAGALQWYEGTNPIVGANSQTYVATESGTYTAELTGSCSSPSNAIEVIVSDGLAPVIVANGPINLCNNETVDIVVQDTYDFYQWYLGSNPIAGATSQQYTVTETGSYSVQVGQGDCEGTSNVIEVNSTVIFAPPIDEDFSACEGSTVLLQVDNIYDTYQWLNNGNPIAGQTNSSYTFVLNNGVDISVTVTDHTCEATSEEISITSISVPQVTMTPSQDVSVCEDVYLLTANSTSGNYQWLLDGEPIDGAVNSTYTAMEDGDYSFTSTTTGSDCTATSPEITVELGVEVAVEIIASQVEACEGQTIELSVVGNFSSVLWSNNATTNSISVTHTGDYSVSISAGGCSATDEIAISFKPAPIANAGEDLVSDCENGLQLVGSGVGSLSWVPDATLNVSNDSNVAFVSPFQTTYYRLVATSGGCTASDEVLVEVDCSSIFIPNTFTPDGDGLNDFFKIEVRGVSKYHLCIFNRWGELLFESQDPSDVWNGGKQDYYAPDGIYFWTLEVLDFAGKPMLDKEHSRGHITILR